jgi:hypothetical protein
MTIFYKSHIQLKLILTYILSNIWQKKKRDNVYLYIYLFIFILFKTVVSFSACIVSNSAMDSE